MTAITRNMLTELEGKNQLLMPDDEIEEED
jgi:hypothetical protein